MTASAERLIRQVCTFKVGNVLFGVDVVHVQEVIRHQDMTPVPLAPRMVTGLINLRGQIVTAIDARLRLGMAERAADAHPVNVVIRTDEGIVSLLVDEIGDVLEVDDAAYEKPPETLPASARALIAGVYKLSPQLLLVLDAGRAVRIDGDGPTKETR